MPAHIGLVGDLKPPEKSKFNGFWVNFGAIPLLIMGVSPYSYYIYMPTAP
jgi:hypothetical protein